MATALVVGSGDMAKRITTKLVKSGKVDRVVVLSRSVRANDIPPGDASEAACGVDALAYDATQEHEVARVLTSVAPDLIVVCAMMPVP